MTVAPIRKEIVMYLVTGATGNVGRDLVDELVRRGDPVRALTRDPDTADLPPAVETVRGATSDGESMERALQGVDAVFLNVVGDVGPVVDALRSSAVRRVVLLSSVCVQTRLDLVMARRLADIEDRVRAVRDDVVALRPNQFMSNALWWRPMLAAGRVEAPFPDVGLPAIDPADIAAVAAAVLHDDGFAGRALVLTGGESTTPRERVAVLADVLGRPLGFREQTEQEFRAAQPDTPDDVLDYMVAMMGFPTPAVAEIWPTVAEVTGRAPHTFRDWAERNRAALG